MADVLFVCVRDDMAKAEALADHFEEAGFSISDDEPSANAMHSCGACVVLWSSAATASPAFIALTQRAMASGRAVIASLSAAAPPNTERAPVFDLSAWDGENVGEGLGPLFGVVEHLVGIRRKERDVEALANDVIQSLRDEELGAAPPRKYPAVAMGSGWTAELPTTFIAPQRPRLSRPRPAFVIPRAGAVRTLAAVVLVAGSAFMTSLALGGAPASGPVARVPIELSVRAPEPTLIQEVAAIDMPIVEPEPVVARGLEPPSAESVRRPARSAPRAYLERVRELAPPPEGPIVLTPVSTNASAAESAAGGRLTPARRAKREKPADDRA